MTVQIPEAIVSEIIETGRLLSARGWVPATSGNFSRRIDADTIAITTSGIDKGELTPADVCAINLHAPLPAGVSAETPLHVALYAHAPDVGAVLHTHSLAATVVSLAHGDAASIALSNYEIVKGIRGFRSHEDTLHLPLFANSQDMETLAVAVQSRLHAKPGPFGFVLAGHGLYAWGATMREARRHIEALEFLLACELERGRYRPATR
jgi:methylthioribulose-1-phosphate dehydratase